MRAVEGRSICVGSDPVADLVLAGVGGVAPFHVDLAAESEGVGCRVLPGASSLWVGALRLREGLVPFGSVCRVGESSLRLSRGPRKGVAPDGPERPAFDGVIVASERSAAVLSAALRAAVTPSFVLLEGEPGVGKSLFAHLIHRASPRREAALVVVESGGKVPGVLAAELFGCEGRGCPEGKRVRFGALERAEGGTLLLEDVDRLPLPVQAALLAAIERGSFQRLGGRRWVRLDARLVATSTMDLRELVNAGCFMAPLYRCFARAVLRLPPLRECLGELEPLAVRFLQEATGEERVRVPPDCLAQWRRYHWPRNVRELRDVIVAGGGARFGGERCTRAERNPERKDAGDASGGEA